MGRFKFWLLTARVCLGLCLIILSADFAKAGDVPYEMSFLPTYFVYSSQGDYHESETLSDYGISVDFSYPLTNGFHIKALSIVGAGTGYEFFGAGLSYEFASSAIVHRQEGDAVEILTFKKWRPYVDAAIGYNSVRTRISVGQVHTDVSEDLFGGVGRLGAGYAINQFWELNCNVLFLYAVSPNVAVMGYGIAAGIRLNLF